MFRGLYSENKEADKYLKTSLKRLILILKGLPGTEIQWRMASSDRFIKKISKSPGKGSREVAVLILLYPYNQSI
jgi:hypothetical protein